MRYVVRLIVTALVVYAGICLGLYLMQRSLVYSPQSRSYGSPEQRLILEVADAQLVISTIPHAGPRAIIYFGGNAEDVSGNLVSFAEAFPDHAIYLMHYRGYGGSSGSPSESALQADALALFDYVHLEHADIAVAGRSLGSGIAVQLASQRPLQHLILVTPYDSVLAIAAQQFPYVPVRWLLKDRYESWRHAPKVATPTLVIQAELDEVIPAQNTERLVGAFRKQIVKRVVLPGVGHNDIGYSDRYLEVIRAGL
jgi:uncharacterized protein